MPDRPSPAVGTLLRHLIERLDGAVEQSYVRAGLSPSLHSCHARLDGVRARLDPKHLAHRWNHAFGSQPDRRPDGREGTVAARAGKRSPRSSALRSRSESMRWQRNTSVQKPGREPDVDCSIETSRHGTLAVLADLHPGGGAHVAVRYLVSHFMDPDVLEMSFLEGSETPAQSRTLEHLPAGRMKGMRLYVLIDLSAASAAEAFAYHVQQFKLGELVGSNTVGAANNNTLLPIAPNFILSISYGRPVHPISKTNWEGVGVAPSIQASPAQALEVAHSLALQRLREKEGVSAENRAEYTWAKAAVDARLNPVTIQPARLQSLAGRFGSTKVEVKPTSKE